MELDDLDMILLKELESDARQGYESIATKMGISKTTVHRRLQRLLDGRIITFATISDPFCVGYEVFCLVGIKVPSGKSRAIADQLAPYPAIKYIQLTTGRYDVMAWVLVRDIKELMQLLPEALGKLSQVIDIETVFFLNVVKNSWRYFTHETGIPNKRAKRDALDEFDLLLIREMEIMPRQTMTELAERVGSDRFAVNRRMAKLLNNGIVKFVSVVDAAALGYRVRALVFLKVKYDRLVGVANSLALEQTIMHVSIISGNFQICMWAIAKDIRGLHVFLDNILAELPEIICYEVVQVVQIHKYSFRMLS
ncbi:MAG: Lrp/AsnC family transcriptional regulator [Dehalococcoidia bacterium]|nr:Lrp/AsnC family transcriptional regulator [Dehalococcoidia bacterium]